MRAEEGERGEGGRGGSPFRFRPARLRFPADAPFFEDGDVERHLRLQGVGPSAPPGARASASASSWFPCPAQGCPESFSSLAACEHHYGLLHRHACAACLRAFPSAHLLHLHLLEGHDALFALLAHRGGSCLYQCLVESCPEKFRDSTERKKHLVQVHCYPSDFRFDKPRRAKSTQEARPPSRKSTFLMGVQDGEDCGDDAMDICLSSENAEEKPPQPVAEDMPTFPPPARQLYRPSVPPTVCFGQGAKRSFQGRKKKA